MFTGIVREVGPVVAVTGGDGGIRLEIEAPATAPLVEIGGSVAINGVCLTAESVESATPGLPRGPGDALPLDARRARARVGRQPRAGTACR